MPAIYVWLFVILLITYLSIYSLQLAENRKTEEDDTGPAILEFGRAFPAEAIRDAMPTANGHAVFLRIYGNKVGCVQYGERTLSCQILKGGSANVLPGNEPNILHIEFNNHRKESGEFIFRNASQAAEVTLWLLGTFRHEEGEDPQVPDPV